MSRTGPGQLPGKGDKSVTTPAESPDLHGDGMGGSDMASRQGRVTEP